MIKLLVKLAFAGLLANAVYHVGSEYLTFIRFRDSVRQAAIYKAKTNDDLRVRILAIAIDYDIPITGDDVSISRDNRLVVLAAPYRKAIEVVPGYIVQWPFNVSLEIETSNAPPLAGAPPPR